MLGCAVSQNVYWYFLQLGITRFLLWRKEFGHILTNCRVTQLELPCLLTKSGCGLYRCYSSGRRGFGRDLDSTSGRRAASETNHWSSLVVLIDLFNQSLIVILGEQRQTSSAHHTTPNTRILDTFQIQKSELRQIHRMLFQMETIQINKYNRRQTQTMRTREGLVGGAASSLSVARECGQFRLE